MIYSANRIPEISDDIINIDNAMKWGYGWELGPFECWDAMGVRSTVNRMKKENKSVPNWVNDMLLSGRETFYQTKDGETTYFDVISSSVKSIQNDPNIINLNIEKSSQNLIKKDWSASLIDLGDDVLNVEFHSALQPTLNPLFPSRGEVMSDAMDLLDSDKFKGLVIGIKEQISAQEPTLPI
ncbi:MAG: hypothetical protein Ct9H90mP7_1080 [Candidatus Neomarinimicrobiota bacterium]|nr:MAG: hypothetical protein Ct9H90mP7_1080 [Candidatus Neomarinimicrobiota bacterium]